MVGQGYISEISAFSKSLQCSSGQQCLAESHATHRGEAKKHADIRGRELVARLQSFGDLQCLVTGAWSDFSSDLHSLVQKCAASQVAHLCRSTGRPETTRCDSQQVQETVGIIYRQAREAILTQLISLINVRRKVLSKSSSINSTHYLLECTSFLDKNILSQILDNISIIYFVILLSSTARVTSDKLLLYDRPPKVQLG